MCSQVPWTAIYEAAAGVALETDAAETLRQALLPSEQELKHRWKCLVKHQVRQLHRRAGIVD